MIEQLAVVIYGAITILIAVVFAYMQHSALGMALIFAAAGVTYLFQFAQLTEIASGDRVLLTLMALSILLTIASALASFAGI